MPNDNFDNLGLVPAGNYMFKINNRNTRIRSELCSELTIKAPELRHWRQNVHIRC